VSQTAAQDKKPAKGVWMRNFPCLKVEIELAKEYRVGDWKNHMSNKNKDAETLQQRDKAKREQVQM